MSGDAADKIDASLPHYEVRCFLATATPGDEADRNVARLLRLQPARYTTDLDAAVGALCQIGWWWHLSHLEAAVTPTSKIDGIPCDNATFYDKEGNPITYRAMVARGHPLALMEAAVMAAFDLPVAFFVNASHVEEVLSKTPVSRRSMMAYYAALEDHRQENIREWTRLAPPTQEGKR